MTMGDRIAVMNEGQIQQIAPPDETYARPANRFVAEFIGSPSMNTLPGTSREGHFEAARAPFALDLPGDLAETTGEVTLGIRPEHVSIHGDPGEGDLAAEVTVVENLGDSAVVYFEFGETEFLARTDPGLGVQSGQEVGLELPGRHLHLFDGHGQDAARVARSVDRGIEASD